MIRIDEIWLSTQPLDMRAGMDTVMAQIMKAFGSIKRKRPLNPMPIF